MPKCSGCAKVINGGKWCRICFVSAYSDQPDETAPEEDNSPTTFLCKTTSRGGPSPQDFIYNSDESTSSNAYSHEESCESNYDEEHPHHHHQQHISTSSEDSFPEKVAVCGEVDRHERDFIELVKDNMLKQQQQQSQHIKRLEEHVKYLRNDVLFLKNDIENKNMVIKYLLGKLRQNGAGGLNDSSNSSMDDGDVVEDSICHTVRINGSVSGPISYGANKTLNEEPKCIDAWSVSITENSMKTLQQSVKQIEL